MEGKVNRGRGRSMERWRDQEEGGGRAILIQRLHYVLEME